MIKALQLTNFRSHAQSTLRMEPITLMVGPAGAGKSNVLKAMLVLQNTIHRSWWRYSLLAWASSNGCGAAGPVKPTRSGLKCKSDQIPDYPDSMAKYVLKVADSPAGLYVLEETLTRRQGQQPAEWVFQRRP